MVKGRRVRDWIDIALALALSVFAIVLIFKMSQVNGYAKVINYTATVRDGIQRLTKMELEGHDDEVLETKISDILDELKSGDGSGRYGIKHIDDENYQAKLADLDDAWGSFLVAVGEYRTDNTRAQNLYQVSERDYALGDDAVVAAQQCSEAAVADLSRLETATIALIVGLLVSSLFKAHDIIRLNRDNSSLSEMAFVDKLTGIANARKCEERLANPDPIPPEVIIECYMFDLNDLKKANDEFGHDVGDTLISGFGHALAAAAPGHMFVGRRGGDEFIAIAVNPEAGSGDAFLARLRSGIAGIDLPQCPDGISYATGCATSAEHPGLTVDQLMDIADKRMYADKVAMKGGRPCR